MHGEQPPVLKEGCIMSHWSWRDGELGAIGRRTRMWDVTFEDGAFSNMTITAT